MAGRFRVAMWVITERRDTVFNGSIREGNPLDERTAITVPLISVDFRVTPRFGLQGSMAVPLLARTGTVQRSTGAVVFRDEVRGVGDATFGAWYRRTKQQWTYTLNAGISAPTGATRPPRFREELEGDSLVPLSRLQRGSGTWDPLFGAAIERPMSGGRWVSSAVVRAPVAANDDGLRTGAAWEIGSGWARTIRTHKVMGYGRVDWLHRNQDVFGGTPVLVGGGNWIYANPGVAVMAGKGINLQAEVKIPIYRDLANRQLDSRAIFQFGVSRSF